MRISSLWLVMALAACGSKPDGAQSLAEAEAEAARTGAEDGRIACRVDGSESFAQVCAVEQASDQRGLILTVSAPSGSFRRLLVTTDGRGVVAADGAEPAVVTPLGTGLIEVAVGNDRYRLPATVKPAAGKAQ